MPIPEIGTSAYLFETSPNPVGTIIQVFGLIPESRCDMPGVYLVKLDNHHFYAAVYFYLDRFVFSDFQPDDIEVDYLREAL